MLWFLALAMQMQDEVRVSSHAYVPQSPYTLRVDTRLVEIAAVVRDGRGRAIAGLTKDDFRILDDGKERLIDHFAALASPYSTINARSVKNAAEALKTGSASVLPRFLALFIDDVNGKDGSLSGDLKRTQTAAEKFVKEALKPDVRIAVFTASGSPSLDFTTDAGKLTAAIGAVKARVRMQEQGATACPRVTPYLAYRIAHDQDQSAVRAVLSGANQLNCPATAEQVVEQAEDTWRKVKEISTDTLNSIGRAVDRLATRAGTRELVIASSGFLTVSMEQQEHKVIDRALRAGVVIGALDSKGLYGEALPGSRPEDAASYKGAFPGAWFKFETVEMPLRLQTLNKPMAELADGTGGVFYHNNNDLNAGFRQVGEPPDVTYRLSFRPEDVAADGRYHKLKVTAKKYSVQARPGYFAPDEKAAQSSRSRVDREIAAEDTKEEFPVGIALRRELAGVSVIVHVDISKLRFTQQGDRRVQEMRFTTALIDAEGKIAAAKESVMELALKADTYKRLVSTGVNAVVTLPISAGIYKLRQITEEGLDGKMACSTHAIELK